MFQTTSGFELVAMITQRLVAEGGELEGAERAEGRVAGGQVGHRLGDVEPGMGQPVDGGAHGLLHRRAHPARRRGPSRTPPAWAVRDARALS